MFRVDMLSRRRHQGMHRWSKTRVLQCNVEGQKLYWTQNTGTSRWQLWKRKMEPRVVADKVVQIAQQVHYRTHLSWACEVKALWATFQEKFGFECLQSCVKWVQRSNHIAIKLRRWASNRKQWPIWVHCVPVFGEANRRTMSTMQSPSFAGLCSW